MYAAMKRDIDKKRSKRDNLILDVGLAVTLGFVVISMRICLAGKWNTVAFGTLVPFVVAVQTYPRKWRRWSMQNGQVESFHGKLRDECLSVSWFGNLFEARRKIVAWRTEYNQERPHSSLGYRTPEEFAREMRDEKGCGKDGGSATLENGWN